jgi:hypothetical protein
MSDLLISVQTGATPWQPTTATELVATWDYYDGPLAGHLRQDGIDYAFWAVHGLQDETGTYVYARVSLDQVREIEASEDFDSALARAVIGKPLVAVVYTEGRGIVGSLVIENPTAYTSLGGAIIASFSEMQLEMGQRREVVRTS